MIRATSKGRSTLDSREQGLGATDVLLISIPVAVVLNIKFHGIRLDVFLALVSLLLSLRGSDRAAQQGRERLVYFVLCFAIVILASGAFNSWSNVINDGRLVGMAIIAYLLYRRVGEEPNGWKPLAYGMILASAVAAIQSFVVPLTNASVVFTDSQGFTRVITTEGPLFLVVGTALSLLLIVLQRTPRVTRIGLGLVLVGCMTELFRTNTKGYIFAVACVCVVLVPVSIAASNRIADSRHSQHISHGGRILFGIAALVAAGIGYYHFVTSSAYRTSLNLSPSISPRFGELSAQVSQQGWDLVIGRGLGGAFRTPISASPYELTTWAHNGFMWWALKLGLPAAAFVFYLVFLRPIRAVYQKSALAHEYFERNLTAAVGLLAVGFISITSNQFTLYGGAYLLGACSGIIRLRVRTPLWRR